MNAVPGRPRPAHADDLDAVLAEAWRLLARGVADRRSPFHTPTLATIGLDGAPALRTMVLRGVEAGIRTLRLHTDRRAGKAAELAADRRVALHVYDSAAQIQVRLAGIATWHHDDAITAAAWAASREAGRLVYAATAAPGQVVPAPPPAPSGGDGSAHFAVVRCRVDRLEWLWLAAAGHRRARFLWTEPGGPPTATWLAP